ncbi:MAG: carbohydrate-binding domain-containing protein [Clostridiales bacterium]|nr:MAG: carbohydrate-binding domain-containing protein [Clostridiales bacterium]
MFETLGASVKWNDESQTVSARKSSKTVSMTVNSAELTVDRGDTDENGNAVTDTSTLDVPAQVISDRVLVPVRAVSEVFGLEANWDNGTQTVEITSEQEDESWKENKGTIDLDTLTYTGNGVEIDGKNIKITEGGDFTVSGTLDGGNITVDTESRVKIRLDGASITTSGSPCIYVENADKAYITQTDKTENYLTANSSENGAVYSKDNLEIKGNGTLYVNSDTGHGIKASDNLTIEDGTVDITAKNDAIHVNDTFKMTGGTLKTVSEGDGIDSESIVKIDGGTVDIKNHSSARADGCRQCAKRQN